MTHRAPRVGVPEGAILQDDCEDCDRRANNFVELAGGLDYQNARRLWNRVVAFEVGDDYSARPLTENERKVFSLLNGAAHFLTKLGHDPKAI